MKHNPARAIFAKFAAYDVSQNDIAAACESRAGGCLTGAAVSGWKNKAGLIPPEHYQSVLTLAKHHGMPLELVDFIAPTEVPEKSMRALELSEIYVGSWVWCNDPRNCDLLNDVARYQVAGVHPDKGPLPVLSLKGVNYRYSINRFSLKPGTARVPKMGRVK